MKNCLLSLHQSGLIQSLCQALFLTLQTADEVEIMSLGANVTLLREYSRMIRPYSISIFLGTKANNTHFAREIRIGTC